jgi:hypothetical protein
MFADSELGDSEFADSGMSLSGFSGLVEVEFTVGTGGARSRGLGIRRRRAVVLID